MAVTLQASVQILVCIQAGPKNGPIWKLITLRWLMREMHVIRWKFQNLHVNGFKYSLLSFHKYLLHVSYAEIYKNA